MKNLPPAFASEIEKVWSALMSDLGVGRVTFVLQPRVLHAFLDQGNLVLPESHAQHFQRFGTVPTSLVRDIAYAAKKQQLSRHSPHDGKHEADAMAYAEAFLRTAIEQSQD